MRRREVLAGLVGATISPVAARAQSAAQARRVWRIGMLETTDAAFNRANVHAFRDGLRALGYVEGQNLAIEYRSAGGRAERFPDYAAEFVRLKVDVIVTRGTPAAFAARNASTTIPVVMAASGEPFGTGVVAGLASPGGRVTGLSSFNTELEPKRLELLTEIAPGIKRVAALYNFSNPVFPARWEVLKISARARGLELELLDVRAPEEIELAFATAVRNHVDALTISIDALTQANAKAIAELAASHRLPAIYPSNEFVHAGGLFAYGVSYPDLYFRAATYVEKVLKGAKPAELPVEQPTKFELAINLKTAKALGLTVSPTLLARADEVIE
jgi:putative tryptophan/tyrosine transport system substrate-binding protein